MVASGRNPASFVRGRPGAALATARAAVEASAKTRPSFAQPWHDTSGRARSSSAATRRPAPDDERRWTAYVGRTPHRLGSSSRHTLKRPHASRRIFLVLPLERVARCAETMGKNLLITAAAVHRLLNTSLHSSTPASFVPRAMYR